MEITIMETSAYLELKRQLSTLSVQMEEFNRKTARRLRINGLTRKRCVRLWVSQRDAFRHIGTGD